MLASPETFFTPAPGTPEGEGAPVVPEQPEPQGSDTALPPTEVVAPPEVTAEGEETGVDVEIPHFRPDQGPIKIPNVPQELADALNRQNKLAARVPKLEKQLGEGADARAKLAFLNSHPVEALQLINQKNPQVGEAFARSVLEQNYEFACKVFEELGIGQVEPEFAAMRAKAARLEAQGKVREGQERLTQTTAQESFVVTAGQVAEEVMGLAGMSGDTLEGEVFQAKVDRELGKIFQSNPRASSDEMLLALQPLIQEAVKLKAAPSKTIPLPPRDKLGQFTEKTARTQQLAKTVAGQSVVPSLGAETAPEKGMTLEQSLDKMAGPGWRG
jgi:hypothetical protein